MPKAPVHAKTCITYGTKNLIKRGIYRKELQLSMPRKWNSNH
jgi:hypothetical protein